MAFVDEMKSNFAKMDAATTKAATAQEAIRLKVERLIQEAIDAPTVAQRNELLAQAVSTVGLLEPLADSLTAMGHDPANPIPVPVPELPTEG